MSRAAALLPCFLHRRLDDVTFAMTNAVTRGTSNTTAPIADRFALFRVFKGPQLGSALGIDHCSNMKALPITASSVVLVRCPAHRKTNAFAKCSATVARSSECRCAEAHCTAAATAAALNMLLLLFLLPVLHHLHGK